jgi:hypothetical protein
VANESKRLIHEDLEFRLAAASGHGIFMQILCRNVAADITLSGNLRPPLVAIYTCNRYIYGGPYSGRWSRGTLLATVLASIQIIEMWAMYDKFMYSSSSPIIHHQDSAEEVE